MSKHIYYLSIYVGVHIKCIFKYMYTFLNTLLKKIFFYWLHRAPCRILVPQPGIELRAVSEKPQS